MYSAVCVSMNSISLYILLANNSSTLDNSLLNRPDKSHEGMYVYMDGWCVSNINISSLCILLANNCLSPYAKIRQYVFVYVCVCVCMYMYVCVYVCMCVCMHVCVCDWCALINISSLCILLLFLLCMCVCAWMWCVTWCVCLLISLTYQSVHLACSHS